MGEKGHVESSTLNLTSPTATATDSFDVGKMVPVPSKTKVVTLTVAPACVVWETMRFAGTPYCVVRVDFSSTTKVLYAKEEMLSYPTMFSDASNSYTFAIAMVTGTSPRTTGMLPPLGCTCTEVPLALNEKLLSAASDGLVGSHAVS